MLALLVWKGMRMAGRMAARPFRQLRVKPEPAAVAEADSREPLAEEN